MKLLIKNKISTLLLWASMLITTGIFVLFYAGITGEPDSENNTGIDPILYWLYIIFSLNLLTTLFFAFRPLFSPKKNGARSIRISLAGISALALLLAAAYMLGNATPLPIPGYTGNENIPFWLKTADMWLYAIYLLTGLTISALIAGIIWSYFKKNG
ncbi:MAG: hypothetical protein LBI65_04205 [Candidatus Symbiothrix sp.]|jgi:hypothetical protein|nr:hypothetical protein [Candidatus Symbiothrix sp.]